MNRAWLALLGLLLSVVTVQSHAAAKVRVLSNWQVGVQHARPSAPRRALIFTAHAEDGSTSARIASVAYGGQTMQRVIERGVTQNHQAYAAAFILDEAGLAQSDGERFSVVWESEPARPPKYSSVFLADVDQKLSIGDVDAAAGASRSLSTKALSTEVGDLVVMAATASSPGAYTVADDFEEGVELSIISADGVSGHLWGDGKRHAASATHSHESQQVVLGFVVRADRSLPQDGADPDVTAQTPTVAAPNVDGGPRVKTLDAYDFFLNTGASQPATAWVGTRIAVVFERESPSQRDADIMAALMTDAERIIDRYTEVTGESPPSYDVASLCDCVIWQVVEDGRGVSALGMVRAAGLSTDRVTFDRIYDSYADGNRVWDQRVLFELGRNYWLGTLYDSIAYPFKGASKDAASPWMTAFSHFLSIDIADELGLDLHRSGSSAREFVSSLRGHLREYIANPDLYNFDNSFASAQLPWAAEPVAHLLSGMLIYLSDAHGADNFARDVFATLKERPALPRQNAHQLGRDNFYVAASRATGGDLREFFAEDLAWVLSPKALALVDKQLPKESAGEAVNTRPVVPSADAAAPPPHELIWRFDEETLGEWEAVDEGTQNGPSKWLVADGRVQQKSDISGGLAVDTDDVSKLGTFLAYPGGASWSDYDVDAVLRSDDDDAMGIMFRHTDADNYYRFSWDRQRRYRRLVKRVDGVFTVLAEDQVAYQSGASYRVTIRARGPRLTVSIEDSPVFQVSDADLASGSIALYAWSNSSVSFDDVRVAPPSELAAKAGAGEAALEPTEVVIIESPPPAPDLRDIVAAEQQPPQIVPTEDPVAPEVPEPQAELQGEASGQAPASEDELSTPAEPLAQQQSTQTEELVEPPRVLPADESIDSAGTAAQRKAEIALQVAKVAAEPTDVASPAIEGTTTLPDELPTNGQQAPDAAATPLLTPLVTATTTQDDGATAQERTDSPNGDNAVLLNESFNDDQLSGWDVVDVGQKRGPSQWSASGGELVQASNISGGLLTAEAIGKPGTFLFYETGTRWRNYALTVSMRSDDDDAMGVMFRVKDAKNYYRLSWDRQRGYRRLVVCEDGKYSLLAEDSTAYERGQEYVVDVVVLGPRLRILIDGDVVFDLEHDGIEVGSVGLYSWANAPTYFGELTVTEIDATTQEATAATGG